MRTRNASPGTVEFIQYHQPYMESGEYEIEVKQEITIPNNGTKTFSRKLAFAISGERFGPLAPTEIDAVFPPADSLGQHISVLPHITLKRSTLPWERFAGDRTVYDNLPWLILLLFRESDFANESDKPKVQSLTLGELQATSTAKFPDIDLEVGQYLAESINIIDVKKKYLQPILPTKAELAYLAHTRQAKNAQSLAQREVQGETQDDQLATIVCNRLPEPSGLSSVYLVSVEDRYLNDGNFDFLGATDEDLIRLVVLASWNFGCIDPKQSFSQLLLNLNNTPNTPRLPVNSNPSAEQFLAQSYVPLPHALREGSKTVSWYRGPLISGSNPDTFDLPVRAADELVRYDRTTGLFDSSYAAAWQLGRMLTLQNQRVAIDLYNWKRENAQYLKQIEQTIIKPPLRSSRQLREDGPSAPPESVTNWFTQLELLQGIPFNYLVPDERLLPAESIRFFWVDSEWVNCLQDGAFSVGRVTNADIQDDRKIRTRRSLRSENTIITGCILRSQVVSGWPNLLVDAYDRVVDDEDFVAPDDAQPLKLLRIEKLAQDVLICLFKGEVKTVDIYLKAEAMHFGLDVDEQTNDFEQKLRNVDGEEIDTVSIYPIPWRGDETQGVINIESLAQKMEEKKEELEWDYEELTSAQFALQMIEAVEKVRFPASA